MNTLSATATDGRTRRPRHTLAPRRRTLHLALQTAFISVLLVPALPMIACAAPDAISDEARPYRIAAGPLGDVLASYAAAANVQISFDAALLARQQSPGLQGRYTVAAGFAQLLSNTGYALQPLGDGKYSVRSVAEQALPLVMATAAAEPSLQDEGSAEAGYRVNTISAVGALGGMALLDTPFSISVVPHELIENIQAQSPDDIYKLNPSTRTLVAQGSGWSPTVSIRGFSTYDSAEDGLRRPYNHAAVTEDKERVEVLNGLSGFLYGAAAPAGMINYVYKRPTMERLNSVTVGNYGGGQAYVHGDFGGRIDEEGRAGYRLNIVRQDGKTAVDDQHIDRTLISGALDWKITDQLLLEFNAAYNQYKTRSPSAYWYYSIPHGRAPNASQDWSQPWIHDEFNNSRLSSKLTYRLSDQITIRTAYAHSEVSRPVQDHTMNAVDSAGEYTQIAIHSGKSKNNFDAAQALVDFRFTTGTVAHTLTTGYFMYASKDWSSDYNPNSGWQGPYLLSAPARVSMPVFPADTSSLYLSGKVSNQNMVIGDNIKFNEQWSVLAGVTHSSIKTQDFNSDGSSLQADYDQARVSPSYSLLFKPVPGISTYATYLEGLETGGRAPDTATNPNQMMAPMVSRQKEIGIKVELGELLLTTAAFDIEKAYEYTDASNVYTQNGRQQHRGIEFTATGKLTRGLTVLGGVTWLDAKVKGGDFDGNAPINVARVLAKLYVEQDLGVPGLVGTGGIYYTGRQWADDANTDRLSPYTTIDLGLRYATRIAAHPITLRLYVNNVTNKNYWANSYYVGSPRSAALSVQYQF